ncbi:MerR family transcriptional regulator [Paenibacillus sp. SN-8-1]|uniref:MerR family transcriptional regulator n=1 Tax=Paenibacillus sp. SN-8-1 TaxID=3435409 RepID=UPI003D9A7FC5
MYNVWYAEYEEGPSRKENQSGVKGLYSIKQVSAAMLNIPTVAIRAWENRYEAVSPERTDAGYRLYTEENIEDLKWLKAQVEEQGASISQAVKMLNSRKKEQNEASVLLQEHPKVGDQTAYAKMEEQIYQALHSFQARGMEDLVRVAGPQVIGIIVKASIPGQTAVI